jgi:hypothetical protein
MGRAARNGNISLTFFHGGDTIRQLSGKQWKIFENISRYIKKTFINKKLSMERGSHAKLDDS